MGIEFIISNNTIVLGQRKEQSRALYCPRGPAGWGGRRGGGGALLRPARRRGLGRPGPVWPPPGPPGRCRMGDAARRGSAGAGGGQGSSLVQFIFPDSLCNHSPRAAPRAGCLLFPPGLQLRSSPWTPGTRATKAALRPSEPEGLATSPSHRPNSVPRARSQLYSHPRADKRGFKLPLLGCPVCFHATHRL